jgi:hypothetical protein
MDVLRLPERVITGPEGPSIQVELVTEYEVPGLSGPLARIRVRIGRGILVDQVEVAQPGSDLTGPVDSTQVVSTERVRRVPCEKGDQRVPTEQGAESQNQDQDTTDVVQSSNGEDGPTPIVLAIPLWVRVMQIVVRLRVVQCDIGTPRRWVRGQRKLVADARCQASRSVVLCAPSLFTE